MRIHRVQIVRVSLAVLVAFSLLPLRAGLWRVAEGQIGAARHPALVAEVDRLAGTDGLCLWRD